MATGINDKYANIATVQANIVAAAYTFTEFQTGISLGQGMGMIIDQIDYYVAQNALIDMDADGDIIRMALATTSNLTSLSPVKNGIIDYALLTRLDAGTAGNAILVKMPITHKFTPPIIVAAPRLYIGTYGVNVTGTLYVRILFRYKKLTTQEYLELAETFLLVG